VPRVCAELHVKVPPSRPGQSCSSRGSRCRSMPGGLYSKHLATDNTSRIGVAAASPPFPPRTSPSRGHNRERVRRTPSARAIARRTPPPARRAVSTQHLLSSDGSWRGAVAEAVAFRSWRMRRQGPTDVPEGRGRITERVARATVSDAAAPTGGKIGVRKPGESSTNRRCSSAAEQGSHKPRVGGSIPPTATTFTRPAPYEAVAVSGASASDAAYCRKASAASSTWARRARLNGLAT
jgi:hypothetical protein